MKVSVFSEIHCIDVSGKHSKVATELSFFVS